MMHITRLIKIAEKPRMMTRSLKKGNEITLPGTPAAGLPDSILENIINNTKQMLQMNVNREKNEINFIKIYCFKKTLNKIILICWN